MAAEVSRLTSVNQVNIAEVAAAAGVSVGTVSRVLNQSPNVRDGTRRRVLEVIGRLNYRPSRLAASLSRGSTCTVVILVPFFTRPSVVARLSGAIGVLDARGFGTVLRNVETPAQRDRHLAALTERHGADGGMVISLRLGRRHLDMLRAARLPLTLVDTEAPGLPCTVTDDIRGGFLAASHLINLGHTRIGFIGDSRPAELGFLSSPRRLLGYRRALAGSGLRYDPGLVRLGAHATAAAAQAALGLLGLPDRPTAIVAASDTQALGVLAAAEQAGLAIPADLSVIGYDDIDAAAQAGLSTVRQPLVESGVRGATRLCDLISGGKIRPLREQLPLDVVARTSSAHSRWRPRSPPADGKGTAPAMADVG
jgi:DNA-binding LacI/PurR family transcriptional regulator